VAVISFAGPENAARVGSRDSRQQRRSRPRHAVHCQIDQHEIGDSNRLGIPGEKVLSVTWDQHSRHRSLTRPTDAAPAICWQIRRCRVGRQRGWAWHQSPKARSRNAGGSILWPALPV
jgi:hypothetical protein